MGNQELRREIKLRQQIQKSEQRELRRDVEAASRLRKEMGKDTLSIRMSEIDRISQEYLEIFQIDE